MMEILSLGWGLQSWTIAAMMALDEMPKCDLAIFADTTWEGADTYKFALKWQEWLWNRDVPVLWAYDHSSHGVIHEEWEGTFIPAYSIAHKDGKRGILNRQCTQRWKIDPMRKIIKAAAIATWLPFHSWWRSLEWFRYDTDYGPGEYLDIVGEYSAPKHYFDKARFYWAIERMIDKYGERIPFNANWFVDILTSGYWIDNAKPVSYPRKKLNKVKEKITVDGYIDYVLHPKKVTQLLGITLDEVERMTPSKVKWAEKKYPLIDKGMRRKDCATWLKKAGLPIPPKSACVFCPFTNERRWVERYRQRNGDFGMALYVDKWIRDQRPNHTIYVHEKRKPLLDAVLESPYRFQMNLFGEEDEGIDTINVCGPHCFI
jgi:hypothetical protein